MKARFHAFLNIAFSTLIALTCLTSCEVDKCKTVACANGSICEDGACLCTDGYEGFSCETEMRQRYLGIWRVTEDGTIANAAQYSVAVERGSAPREIRIKNFYNSFTQPVKAYVNSDTLSIPLQAVNKWKVQGRGQIKRSPYSGVNGLIELRYRVEDTVLHLIDNYGLTGGDPSIWNK